MVAALLGGRSMNKNETTRRDMLAGLGAAAAAVAAPPLAWAQPAKMAKPKHHGVIDVHHHFWSPEYLKAQVDWSDAHHVPNFPAMMKWSPQMSLDVMDKAGVQTSVVSLASISDAFWGLDAPAATRVVKSCDDFGAKMVSDHKGRFGLFAPLSMVDVDTSLKELEYAFDQVHADGIGLQSSYNGKYVGDPAFAPIWEELNRRKAVVFIHGPNPGCCSGIEDGPGMSPSVVEVTFDVTRSAACLLSNGALAKYPNISWIIAYGGGTLPFVAGRIEAFVNGPMKFAGVKADQIAPNGVMAELQRLHFDTVNVTNAYSMAALLKFAKPTHVLYGTDFIYFHNDQLDNIDQRGLSAKDKEAILAGNAKRLIPRLAKA
jgi:predicted TIM-barrel fold metal-dependent hydrolase